MPPLWYYLLRCSIDRSMPAVDCGFPDRPGQPGRDLLAFFGPSLLVEIGFDRNFRPNTGVRPRLLGQQFPALVDTGAAESCIDSALAIRLKLPIVDRQKVAGVHGRGEVDKHLAQIYVPASARCHLYRAVSAGRQTSCPDLRPGFGRYGVRTILRRSPDCRRTTSFALIGRTFLRNFTLVYEGRTGAVTLS